jgi:hypothetical protein
VRRRSDTFWLGYNPPWILEYSPAILRASRFGLQPSRTGIVPSRAERGGGTEGRDTAEAEKVLQNYEEALEQFHVYRQLILDEIKRQEGPDA